MREFEAYYYDMICTRLENCLLMICERTRLLNEQNSMNCDGLVDACEQMRKGLDEFKTLNELATRNLKVTKR